MRKNKWIAAFLSCALLCTLAGCGGDKDTSARRSAPGGTGTWSVFVYLCGTDLESGQGSATENLNEMLAANTENINLIVQTGGTSEWMTDGIDPSQLQRFQIADGSMELVDSQPLASMGDPATLGSFLSWGVENYPADHYMVTFWNHGGGSVAGVEFDELYNFDSLTLDELSQGLAAAGETFDLVGFDTCLMSTLENAIAVAPYGQYMVASEEYEPGGGWEYTTWLDYLSENPGATGADLGPVICDSYLAKCEDNGTDDMATLAVTDLSAIGTLTTSFDAMAAEMTGVTGDMSAFQTFAQGAMKAENYGGNNDDEGYTNMVDLGDLTLKTKDVLPQTATDVYNALSNAVVYQVQGAARQSATGLAVYFPLAPAEEELNTYQIIAPSAQYLRFIEAVTGWTASDAALSAATVTEDGTTAAAPPAPVENSVYEQKDNYSVGFATNVTEDGFYQLQVTQGLEAVESVDFTLFYYDETADAYVYLGIDNDIDADWDNGVFQDNFQGMWPAIDGVYCSMTMLASEDDYILYTVPVLLNGAETNLRVMWIWDSEDGDGHFEVVGAWDGVSESGAASRDVKLLAEGDQLTLLTDSYDGESGDSETVSLGDITVGAGGRVNMEYIDLIDGLYDYSYTVTDVFGNEQYSDSVTMECDAGELYIYEP